MIRPCLFCPPGLDETEIILESDHCFFVQQPQPVLTGSGLVVPRQHRETVFDLTAVEWQDTYALLQRVKNLLDAQYAPDGYNLGWNVGPVGGQEVFHAHLHVIPRFRDEPLAGKGIRYWLKQETNKRVKQNRAAGDWYQSPAAIHAQATS